jgi:hypothetical protein
MANVLNLTQYEKQAYTKKAMFIYRGTAALKKGHGMCFDLDYATTTTGETATDNFGTRGLKEVQVPVAANRNAFAGVLTQNYAANPNGLTRKVELALPGSCAEISQRVESTINTGLVTCTLGTGTAANSSSINGVFGHGGLYGLGSAIPLQTLSSATSGDMAFQNITGTATTVYSSATGLTTVTLTGAGTALGYTSATVAADSYEMTVWGGATAADSTTERCPSGVYPVVNATGANTFTVTGDTGDGACTVNLVKKDLLTLAYLCDGEESGLADIYIPYSGNTTTYISGVSGTSIVLGGLTLAADDESDVADGTMDGQRKAFYMLATLVTSEMLWDVTSGYTLSGTAAAGTTLSTIEMNTAGEWAVMRWHQFGPASTGAWVMEGVSDTGVAIA